MYAVVVVALILCLLLRALNVNTAPEKSQVIASNSGLAQAILAAAPALHETYIPTRLWGFSGHVQTAIQGVLSRFYVHPRVDTQRCRIRSNWDGATITFDLYEPRQPPTDDDEDDWTLALCPGICNSSESVYIRRFVSQSRSQFRVACLNHLGTLKSVPLTSPRIFSYGDTNDYAAMVSELGRRFPRTKIVCVGFSMGGNIVAKYLGEPRNDRPDSIVGAISACQGYDAVLAQRLFLDWSNGRRLYLFAMTENMRSLLHRHQKQLFTDEVKRDRGVVEREVFAAATLIEIDDAYTRKLHGMTSVEELYRSMSCSQHLANITVPTVFINAKDDPIVPEPLLNVVRQAASSSDKLVYVEQRFGGHLGFYEGGRILPNNNTWLDRALVEIATALVTMKKNGADTGHSHDRNQDNGFCNDASHSSEKRVTIPSSCQLSPKPEKKILVAKA